ncbi:uncharacterized protein LOC111908308 [Lactuca sativa]|uniref:Uncharacterized protein n=1 Tax=Lactuca sativa TaxID=4236 RepID=A0A9R1WJC8_LACSA|nr:uncharacterized protein LOC111908308 [Lactuca sativa]KAJ0226501.1 hypothetical protein LSAT_V11C100042320 [Lactuca sativa]
MTSSPPPLQHHQINTTAIADGSSTTTSTSTTTPWSCETNWTVTRGSLDSAVTFESFDFPIDSEPTGPKPPLLLVPPSTSDFEPCEIKLNFTQKHEIRQVYVRSTARVYEIYYAPDLHSENEYLCTVRCNAASVTDVKNAISANLEGLNEISPKGRVSGENNIGTNEDDWVEIKLPVGNTYSPNQTSNAIRNYQNYYEATAEMNDSEPCKSLTLRLLSLQSKGFVHVDEVYVFADCIHSDDSQNQNLLNHPEPPSSGTSLMTMLVPTLLGLSKSRSIQSTTQHSTSKSVEKPINTESQPTTELTRCQLPPSTAELTRCDNRTESSGGFPVAVSNGIGIRDSESGGTDELTRCHVGGSSLDKEKIHEPNTSLMEQLVSRVSRIEDMLLRFEENMLNPINHIESRLHHVEQQLQSLTKNPQIPVLPSSPTSQPKSENTNQFHAQHSEEKQQLNNDFEKPKKSVSIDDALAAALAGFSSFTKPKDEFPVLPLESTSIPSESFLNNSEDLTTTYADVSTDIPSNKTDVHQDSIESVNILTFDKNADQSPDVKQVSESVNVLTFDKNDDQCPDVKEVSESVNVLTFDKNDDQCPDVEDGSESVNILTFDKNDDQCPDVEDGSESVNVLTFDKKQDSIESVNKILTFDKNDILKHFPDGSPDVKDGFECDFETCVLEVKFASMENGNLKSHLEDFLSYTDENPAMIDEGLLIEETTGNGNSLLLDLDGDDVAQGVLQDLPNVHVEPSFDSLI